MQGGIPLSASFYSIMIGIYIFLAVVPAVALFNLSFFSKGSDDLLLILLCSLVAVTNVGYLFLALSTELEEVVLANKISYIGGVLIGYLVVLIVARICGVKIPRPIEMILFAAHIIVLGLVFSTGYSSIYYDEIYLKYWHGIAYIDKTYGPAHIWFLILTYGEVLYAVAIVIYFLIRKKSISTRSALILLVALVGGSGVYIVQRTFNVALDPMPVIFVLALLVVILLCRKLYIFDMSENVLSVYQRLQHYGYLTFDADLKYMGCNEFICELFPFVKSFRVDEKIRAKNWETNPDFSFFDKNILFSLLNFSP